MSYSADRESEIKKTADQVFAQLPEMEKSTAETARMQLYWWLSRLKKVGQKPYLILEWLNIEETFKQRLGDSPTAQQAWQAFQSTFADLFSRTHLCSRSQDTFLWEQTGFHADMSVRSMNCKVGARPYQPMGFDNMRQFISTEGGKTLWLREFILSFELAWLPPFSVTVTNTQIKVGMTEELIARIKETINWFSEELESYNRLSNAVDEERRLVENRIRETLKLACIQMPFLDEQVNQFAEANPGFGPGLQKADPAQICVVISEFLRMKLDDDFILKTVTNRVLHVEDRVKLESSIIKTLKIELSRLKENLSNPFGPAVLQEWCLDTAFIFTDLREQLTDGLTDTQWAQIVEEYLNKREMKLCSTPVSSVE